MGSWSWKNCGVIYLLCVTYVFIKYAWVKLLKDETAFHGFTETVNKSKAERHKSWVDQGRDFHNNIMQKWPDNNNILMYSTNNEGKSIVAVRFVRTWKDKVCKNMTTNDR